MDKIKTVKIKNLDGSVSEETYTISVDAKDVDMANGKELQETIGTINIDTDGNIAYQLDDLKNNKVNKTDIIDNLNSIESNKVLSANQGKILGDAITVLNEDVKKKVYYFDTVADMKNANLKIGDMVVTLGYYNKNDGGGATYKITNEESQIEYQENLENGLYATLIVKNNYNVLKFGVKSDGSTDSSAVVQNILENIMSEDETLMFPKGLYLFNSPINMTNCFKRNVKGDFLYNYNTSITNGLRFNSCSGFINCNTNQFDGLLINGTAKNGNDGFQGRRMTICNCSISNFNNGINGRGKFTGNTINRCYNGITACVDSRILNNTINANTHHGIALFQGCNDNIISDNKIEWNEASGISAYITTHNVIANNVIDRNTNNGIALVSCTGELVANNYLRRNGLSSATKNRSNFYIEGCTRCIICNNSTQANNSQDDGSGTLVPLYSLEINTSSNMYLIGNGLSGGTNDNPIYYGTGNTEVRILGADNEIAFKYRTQKTINSNGGTNTFEIHCNKTGDYSQPNFHRLIATCRTGSDGDYGFLEFYVYNYKQYGSHRIKLSNDTINTYLTMTASYDSDEDKYYITITNSSTSQNFNVQLYEY